MRHGMAWHGWAVRPARRPAWPVMTACLLARLGCRVGLPVGGFLVDVVVVVVVVVVLLCSALLCCVFARERRKSLLCSHYSQQLSV
jgi:hypothetical protein